MSREEFESMVAEEFEKAIPEKFRPHIKNIAILIEEESPDGELLGLYHGIPTPMRGDWYGMGATLPDTITLFQKPIESEADILRRQAGERVRSGPLGQVLPSFPRPGGFEKYVRQIIRETIWHEVAHHFGFDEDQVQRREDERNDNISS